MKQKNIGYDLRKISLGEVRTLCEQHHGYGSAGKACADCNGKTALADMVVRVTAQRDRLADWLHCSVK